MPQAVRHQQNRRSRSAENGREMAPEERISQNLDFAAEGSKGAPSRSACGLARHNCVRGLHLMQAPAFSQVEQSGLRGIELFSVITLASNSPFNLVSFFIGGLPVLAGETMWAVVGMCTDGRPLACFPCPKTPCRASLHLGFLLIAAPRQTMPEDLNCLLRP